MLWHSAPCLASQRDTDSTCQTEPAPSPVQPSPDDTSQNPRLPPEAAHHLVSDEGVKFNEAVPKSSIPK